MNKLLDTLEEYKDELIDIDRIGKIINFYFPNDVRVQKIYPTVERAIKEYTVFRKTLLDIKVG